MRIMTRKEFVEASVNLYKYMMRMHYSIDLIEIVGDLLCTFPPKEAMESAVLEFTKIAKMELPEQDFHLEISKKYKELQGL